MRLMLILAVLVALPLAHAYQFRFGLEGAGTELSPFVIENPETSQLIFAGLEGAPEFYTMYSDVPFTLYLRMMAPDLPGYDPKKVSLLTLTDSRMEVSFVYEDSYFWGKHFDGASGTGYLAGPEIRKEVAAGTYVLKVFNSNNSGAYALAVGTEERASTMDALASIPVVRQYMFLRPINLNFLMLIGMMLAASAVFAIHVAARAARNRDYNKALIGIYRTSRYAAWTGIIIAAVASYYLFESAPVYLFYGVRNIMLAIAAVYWLFLFLSFNGKFKKITEKKAFVAPRFQRNMVRHTSILLAIIVLLALASVV